MPILLVGGGGGVVYNSGLQTSTGDVFKVVIGEGGNGVNGSSYNTGSNGSDTLIIYSSTIYRKGRRRRRN